MTSTGNNITVLEYMHDMTTEEVVEAYNLMTPAERSEFESLLKTSPPRALMPHQEVPVWETWWEVYLLVGGRGVGKTVAGASEARAHLRKYGKHARIGIGAPTNADARDTCMEGQTGLITMFPNEFKSYNRSLGEARHIDGGIVKAMGTEQPKRWNGPQWSMLWFDELALCNQAAWDDANLGLRMGKRPYAVCTTTPKNRKWVKKLAFDKTTYVPQYIDDETGKVRLPTTFDNKFLPQRRVDFLKNKYGGSRLGRQELEGVFVDDIDGAKWNREIIKIVPDTDNIPQMLRTIVAVDPAGSRSRATADTNALTEEQRQNQKKNADTAIAVVGLGADGRFYVLEVKSDQWGPEEWASEAIKMFHKWRADKIVAERNFGGDMVENTIRTIDKWDRDLGRQLVGRHLPIKVVVASKGKDIRAEPVVTLYEQGRVWHRKHFAEAEDQMCAFIDADENEGADMVDALVWAVIELAGLGIEGNNIIITPGDPRFNTIQIVR
jgi:predicted phage terminase large subunit-like protein